MLYVKTNTEIQMQSGDSARQTIPLGTVGIVLDEGNPFYRVALELNQEKFVIPIARELLLPISTLEYLRADK